MQYLLPFLIQADLCKCARLLLVNQNFDQVMKFFVCFQSIFHSNKLISEAFHRWLLKLTQKRSVIYKLTKRTRWLYRSKIWQREAKPLHECIWSSWSPAVFPLYLGDFEITCLPMTDQSEVPATFFKLCA